MATIVKKGGITKAAAEEAVRLAQEAINAAQTPEEKAAAEEAARIAEEEAAAEAKEELENVTQETDDKVMVSVPRQFNLWEVIDGSNVKTTIYPGNYKLPRSQAEHQYAKDHGVQILE